MSTSKHKQPIPLHETQKRPYEHVHSIRVGDVGASHLFYLTIDDELKVAGWDDDEINEYHTRMKKKYELPQSYRECDGFESGVHKVMLNL